MLVLDFALEFKCGCKAGYGYNTKQSMIGAYPGPGVNRHTPVNDQHKQLKLDFKGIYVIPALQASPNTKC